LAGGSKLQAVQTTNPNHWPVLRDPLVLDRGKQSKKDALRTLKRWPNYLEPQSKLKPTIDSPNLEPRSLVLKTRLTAYVEWPAIDGPMLTSW